MVKKFSDGPGITHGNELKFVYSQQGLDPSELVSLEFKHFWLQPMDGPTSAENTRAASATRAVPSLFGVFGLRPPVLRPGAMKIV